MVFAAFTVCTQAQCCVAPFFPLCDLDRTETKWWHSALLLFPVYAAHIHSVVLVVFPQLQAPCFLFCRVHVALMSKTGMWHNTPRFMHNSPFYWVLSYLRRSEGLCGQSLLVEPLATRPTTCQPANSYSSPQMPRPALQQSTVVKSCN